MQNERTQKRRTLYMLGTMSLALSAVVAGCGESGPPVSIHPVSGKVLLASGKPLSSGTVHFEPVDAPALKASGKIQPDGTFSLTTRKEGDGAAEGDCLVYVLPEGSLGKGASPFPPEFMDPEGSNLRVTVKPGTNQLNRYLQRGK